MKKLFKFIFLINFLSFGIVEVCSDLQSSIPARERALGTEKIYIENLKDYLIGADKKLDYLKLKLQSFKEIGLPSKNSTQEISFFNKLKFQLSTNHLMAVWNNGLENKTKFTATYEEPSDQDLQASAEAIVRIQDMYLYKAKEIASGSFLKVKNKSKLKSFDCFTIGLHYYRNIKDLPKAEDWFDEAYEIYEKNEAEKQDWNSTSLAKLMEYLGYLKSLHGDLKNLTDAIYFTKQSLKINPTNKAIKGLATYEKAFEYRKNNIQPQKKYMNFKEEFENYNMGCRGELEKTPEEIRNLYCKYETENHPFLKLAPMKVEIHNLEPYVAVYYDILYDSEIETIKGIATPQLKDAKTWSTQESKHVISKVRNSQSVFIPNETHKLMSTINQRVTDISGLTTETAEYLQVANYGSGGHYNLHSDYFPEVEEEPNIEKQQNGNRIATVLFYISDVEQGGATVFPNIKTTVFPKKGSAVFWYNLFPGGVGDPKSRHAACPVIYGSKWICNKWIRMKGQEFVRPCKKSPLER